MVAAAVDAHDRLPIETLIPIPDLDESHVRARRIVHRAEPAYPIELRRKRNAGTVLQVAALPGRAHDADAIVAKSRFGLEAWMVGREREHDRPPLVIGVFQVAVLNV